VIGVTVADGVAITIALIGLAGIVIPVLPGTLLVAAGLIVWAMADGTAIAWVLAGVGIAIIVGGQIAKWLIPDRLLRDGGVPRRTVVLGGLLGIGGFFILPVVGLFLGFVLGVYLAELQRVGRERARASSIAALKATGLSVLIELVAGLLATSMIVVGVAAW
jgi:hypothetical protein